MGSANMFILTFLQIVRRVAMLFCMSAGEVSRDEPLYPCCLVFWYGPPTANPEKLQEYTTKPFFDRFVAEGDLHNKSTQRVLGTMIRACLRIQQRQDPPRKDSQIAISANGLAMAGEIDYARSPVLHSLDGISARSTELLVIAAQALQRQASRINSEENSYL
jgi:hypothetical protein